jgi:hypothetical protein
MWITDAVVAADVAGLLKLAAGPSALPAYWATVISLTHSQAYQDILAALAARGYAPADVQSWGAGPGQLYERKLALFYAAQEGGGFAGVSDRFINGLDVRKQLETIQLTDANGNAILTTANEPGTVGFGPIEGMDRCSWDRGGPGY